jgi:hypothetical protein
MLLQIQAMIKIVNNPFSFHQNIGANNTMNGFGINISIVVSRRDIHKI